MKKIILFSITIFLFIYVDNCFARTTNENEVNTMFRECIKIICAPEETSDISFTQSHIALGYAIEIIKKSPDSLESYHIINIFNDMKFNDESMKKYNELKDKYANQLNDIIKDLPEKIIFVNLLLATAITKGLPEIKEYDNKCYAFLIKVRNECQDKRYAAIATQKLFFTKNEDENTTYFLDNFPTHPAIYLVEFCKIQKNLINNEPGKCIAELNKWMIKYKDYNTPFGWRAIMHAYKLLIVCYITMDDFENAKKYYDILETGAPDYPDLYTLKKFVDKKVTIDK